jgi:hypothetical protein
MARLWVERFNGVPNAVEASGPQRDVIPDFARFQRLAELLQAAQDHELLILQRQERRVAVGCPLPAEAVTAAALVEAAKQGRSIRPPRTASRAC